jgi:hypothetical protein
VTDEGPISSETLAEITIDIPYSPGQDEIYTPGLVEACSFVYAPALHILRWTFDLPNACHPGFTDFEEDDPTVPCDQFPTLERVEIHFRSKVTEGIWNCSALKACFREYSNLDFVFSVTAHDRPVE